MEAKNELINEIKTETLEQTALKLTTTNGKNYVNTSEGKGAVNFNKDLQTKALKTGSVLINLNLPDFINYYSLDMILNNEIIKHGSFELYNFDEIYIEEVKRVTEEVKEDLQDGTDYIIDSIIDAEELKELKKELETPAEIIEELQEHIDNYALENIYSEIYQYFIINESDLKLWSKYTNYEIYHSEELDVYLLGISHFGMSWTYFKTDCQVTHYLKEGF